MSSTLMDIKYCREKLKYEPNNTQNLIEKQKNNRGNEREKRGEEKNNEKGRIKRQSIAPSSHQCRVPGKSLLYPILHCIAKGCFRDLNP